MTALLSRVAPSPVPLADRSFRRDVTNNLWVQSPDERELIELFADLELRVAAPVAVHRRPSPVRDHS